MRFGWIGLGRMGRPMITNLIRKGFDVTVQNRTQEKLREFTDSTGQFTVTARFVEFKAGKAYLKKTDGDVIGVSMQKLSKEDQKYIRDLLKSRK